MIKIALTGATGFIGSYVLQELQKLDVKIIAVTRKKFSQLPKFSNCEWFNLDLKKVHEDIFTTLGSPDVLIHLAWFGLPNYNSLHHFESELPSHFCFLKYMIMGGLKTVLVAGTCFEYGMQCGSLKENMLADPANPYGFAKKALYEQLVFLQHSKQFNLIWPRIFYIYGKGQSETSLYSQIQKTVGVSSVFNMSSGEQLLDYSSVEFVATSLVNLALKQQNIGIVNVCSGKPVSVRSLVENWIESNKWDLELNLGYYEHSGHEPMAFWGNRKKFDKFVTNV